MDADSHADLARAVEALARQVHDRNIEIRRLRHRLDRIQRAYLAHLLVQAAALGATAEQLPPIGRCDRDRAN